MAPLYDPLFRRFYRRMREESIAALQLQPSDTVLLVGAGTGLDIRHVPAGSRTVALDITPAMLRRAAAAYPQRADFVLGDGSALPLRDASVSAVVLHLVLSVAPDPEVLMREASRVVRVGGRAAILDHFASGGRVGVTRRLLARFPILFGTYFDRKFEDLPIRPTFKVRRDRRMVGGTYRSVLLDRVDPEEQFGNGSPPFLDVPQPPD